VTEEVKTPKIMTNMESRFHGNDEKCNGKERKESGSEKRYLRYKSLLTTPHTCSCRYPEKLKHMIQFVFLDKLRDTVIIFYIPACRPYRFNF